MPATHKTIRLGQLREPDTRRNLRLARFRTRFVARPRYAAMRRYALHPPGFRSPHRKRSIAATGGMLARRPLKTNMRQGENAMFEILDRRTSLTGNQIKILAAAIIGDALEFFDYFLIGFVLAFLIGPWKLTFGQSATVLMSSGIGAIIGAYLWGWLADRIGRRVVFIGTVLNFSIATGLLYFTPENGWVYLAIMRFFVGTGVGGLYCVDLPLVQEFMPSSKRGWVGGLVTCVIPLGVGLGAVMGGFMGSDQWRLLFAIGVLPAFLVLLGRPSVPDRPRWLCRQWR